MRRTALLRLALLAATVAATTTAGVGGLALAASQPAPASALPAQSRQGVTRHLYLIPADNSVAQLQTHLAKLTLANHSDGSISAIMDATYRIKNDTDTSITIPLVLYAGVGSALPQGIAMTANGVPLSLGTNASGASTAQVEVAADSLMVIRLSYRVTVADAPIVTVRYAPGVLRKWLGPTSTRIEYAVPDAMVRSSWTKIGPDNWTYAVADLGYTGIKWLYDSVVPDEAFVVQFVQPVLWSQIQVAEANSAAGGPASAYLLRGDLYRDLASNESADESVRERFAAQAIAAYADGIAQGASASTEELARMHIGLATLYRDRAARPERDTVAHAALMVDEATAALSLLETGDARRSELQQWLSDGLHTLFLDARNRGDWQRVSQVVDQMDALPLGSVDPALIEEGRQIVLVQQALQLLRRGEADAAAALVGSEITTESAAPPTELQPLFAAWHITVTAEPDVVQLDIVAWPQPGNEVQAQGQLEGLSKTWQDEVVRAQATGSGLLVSAVQANPETGALRLYAQAPAEVLSDGWASYVPSRADYAFLYSVLSQLGPKQEERTRFFQQETHRSQPMDLRSAGDRWTATAADIERRAADIQKQVEDQDARKQLLAEMQAAGYRNTAEAWRNLADDSWLRFQFRSEEPDAASSGAPTRAWYATAKSAPVVFTVQNQTANMSLFGVSILALAAAVIGFSGLLWWLM